MTSDRTWSAEFLASLPAEDQQAFIQSLSSEELDLLDYDWSFWARDKQLIPQGAWQTWLNMAGRGWGKTRVGAESVRELVMKHGYKRVALIGRTAADVRDVMIEGESGLLRVFPPWERPLYEPSKRRVTFPNGAIATSYSGDKPDQLRGPQHDLVWADELAAWRYPESWDQAQFGLRLGDRPRSIVTTTPRPTEIIRQLIKEPGTVVTHGTTYENIGNLAPSAVEYLKRRYEGTRLGQQELMAMLLDDVPGALWTRAILEQNRRAEVPTLRRVVVAIDPAISAGEDSNQTGIVVAGVGADGQGYVLDDVTVSGSPDHWARVAVYAYYNYNADRIVAESNQGGDMVEHTIRMVDGNVPVKLVRATKGKYVRAEPVSALYEQGRVHHVGFFAELEDQLCTWVPGEDSPDRLDALVWAMTELMLEPVHALKVISDNFIMKRR